MSESELMSAATVFFDFSVFKAYSFLFTFEDSIDFSRIQLFGCLKVVQLCFSETLVALLPFEVS